jgi:fucose permease
MAMVGYFGIGAAAGGLDTGLNGYVSIHRPRRLSTMHGGFGIGATVGPWAVTAMRAAGLSWRFAFLGFAAYEAALVVVFVVARGWFRGNERSVSPAATGDSDLADVDVPLTGESLVVRGRTGEPILDPHPRAVLLPLIMLAFFLYVGLEAGLGAWGYTLLVGRGVDAKTAGLAVALYFAAIMVGRFAIGAIGGRVGPRTVLAISIVGALVCTFALVVAGDGVAGLGAVVFIPMGLCLAGTFPSLVALNPERLGTERTTAVIGWQLAAASIGLATLPALIGVAVGRLGAASIAPALAIAAVGLATVHVTAVFVERGDHTPSGAIG